MTKVNQEMSSIVKRLMDYKIEQLLDYKDPVDIL